MGVIGTYFVLADQSANRTFLTRRCRHFGWASVFSGSNLAKQGQADKAIYEFGTGVADLRASKTQMGEPFRVTLMAEAYSRAGNPEHALDLANLAVTTIEKTGERLWEPETHRIKAEIMLRMVPADVEGAQACFYQAIEVAQKQSARSLELRATISLARLLAQQGNREEAYATLAEIYGWFTEGFDTRDLQEARQLLNELDQEF